MKLSPILTELSHLSNVTSSSATSQQEGEGVENEDTTERVVPMNVEFPINTEIHTQNLNIKNPYQNINMENFDA